ncbi:hypothetical protein [Maribacter sp. 2-571]|uniref:hypothetical protein n=1 Tax=Maribacter sp. 2-571 TaxID=3417569 RepID=UPI003D352A16
MFLPRLPLLLTAPFFSRQSVSCFFFLISSFTLLNCQTTAKKPKVAAADQWRPLRQHLLGANANLAALDRPWENDSLIAITAKTGIKTLRYPGGTIGNYWDWDTGAIDKAVPDSLMIKWVVENGFNESSKTYTMEHLALLYKDTGIVPIFMLNMLSKDLEHSVRNLKKARKLGIPIRYIEMGNELYFDIPFPLLRFPTPESYGKTCQLWITALKKEFPEASFALVGNTLKRHDRQIDWNQRMLKHCTNADAMVLHTYSPSGLDGRLERKKIAPGSEGLGAQKTATRKAPKDLAERQAWERELLKDRKAYANMFTSKAKQLKKLDAYTLPEGMELWVTEFNIRDDNSIVLHSWAQTLILSEYYFTFLTKDVTISNLHNLIGNLFGMVHTDSLNFEHLKSGRTKSIPYTLSAGGMCTFLFNEAMADMTSAAPLQFENALFLTDDRGEKMDVLKGWSFSNGKNRKAIIVNYGFEERTVSLMEDLGTKGTIHSYNAPPESPVIGFDHVDTAKASFEKQLQLPPHSISIITFE